MEVDAIPPPTQEKTRQVESADLVVGVLAELDHQGVATLCEGLRTLPKSPRVVVLHNDAVGGAAAGTNAQTAQANDLLVMLPWSALGSSPSAVSMQSVPAACSTLFAAVEKFGAKACCVVSSRMETAQSQWVCELIQPLLEAEFDLAVPFYTPSKLQGLLNSSILYPLTRALYGRRIHNPLGPDMVVSRQLAQKILAGSRNAKGGSSSRMHPLASLVPVAACESLQICQVHVGARVYPPANWTSMSSVISQVLAPIFLDMERTAACWQRTRGSVSGPVRGEPATALTDPQDSTPMDLIRMVETFQLGVRDLQEIWGLVLPPATLFELRKLSRLPPEQVHLPDELWARIVYDFALAHRLRTVNSDHLLQSMTPLYLAWVSSYVREMESVGAATLEQRIERLALAFEAAKPYLVSRWRWPDRFNP